MRSTDLKFFILASEFWLLDSSLITHYSLLITFLRQLLRRIPPAPQHIVFHKARVLLLQRHIDANAVLRPLSQKVAIVQIRQRRLTKLGVGFMVTTAPADPANPTGLTHRLVADMGAVDELVEAVVL